MNPQELQDLLDELEASRASRKRAWENLQEIRWVLKDTSDVELPPPARKTIDLEGRIVKDGVKKSKLATSIFPLKDGVFPSEDSMAANESCKGKLSKAVRDSGTKSLTLLCKLHEPKKMNPSPFHNRIRKVCALVTAALILPALAYAGDDQGDGRPGINPGVPNGTYAWHSSGSISGTPVKSAAQLTFFANGNITLLRSSSFGGAIVERLLLKGTFTVNGDGSVSLSLTTPSETINFDAYFTPDGNTFTFVETDPGTNVNGFATRGRLFY